MEKQLYLQEAFSKILEQYPELEEILEYAKGYYMNDSRPLDIIKKEIDIYIKRYIIMEDLINKDIDEEILNKTIIFIGPMGVGKSTISKKISEQTGLEKISLDDRDKLSNYYKNRDTFENFKDFEFYLMASVLTNLEKPKIIDFGAGHSIYEDPLMFMEFKKLISRFKNVVLLMPTEDKEESLKIINERIKQRGVSEHQLYDNKHFVESPCNYEIATIREYTDKKNVDEITAEILEMLNKEENIRL